MAGRPSSLCFLPENELMGHEMDVFILKVSKDLNNCYGDAFQSAISNVGNVGFFNCSDNLLDGHRLNSKNFTEDLHGFNVSITHSGAHHSSGLRQGDQGDRMWWASEGGWDDDAPICFIYHHKNMVVGLVSVKTTFPALRAMWHLSHRI